MNLPRHKDFYELRFLLHGNRDKYESDDTLYISRGKPVWEKVAHKVLESWRIIPPMLAGKIQPEICNTLFIEYIEPETIINELLTNSISITGNDLSQEERKEILRQISSNSSCESLWKRLPLHETVDGKLVNITTNTYLDNPAFPLDSQFQDIVTLIKISDALRENWITQWTPQTAINVILNQEHPAKFYLIILKLLPQVNEELISRLKQTKWLPLKSGGVISPEKVVLVSENFIKQQAQEIEQALEMVFKSEKSSYATLSMLSEDIPFSEPIKKILPKSWYDDNILEFLLEEIDKPSNYCQVILKVIKIMLTRQRNISKDNLERLKNKKWLIDANARAISLQKVINFSSLEDDVTTILELIEPWDYVTPKMLRYDISLCLQQLQIQELFVTGDLALDAIGEAIDILQEYHIGNIDIHEVHLDSFLKTFNYYEGFPILKLAQKILPDKFKKYILSKALQPIGTEELVKLLQWIVKSYESPSEEVVLLYNLYLKMAVNSLPEFYQKFLPKIQLLNKSGKWKFPHALCCSTGIDNEYILIEAQQEILNKWLANLSLSPRYNTVEDNNYLTESVKSNAQILEEYFRPWRSYIPSEAIGIFLSLLSGTDTEVQKLAQDYLRGRNFDDIRHQLLWSHSLTEKNFTISVLSDEDRQISVVSLLGGSLDVMISQSQTPEHIFIMEPTDTTSFIRLSSFKPKDSVENELPNILFNSAKFLLERIYKAVTRVKLLKDIWDESVFQPRQQEVKVARNHILKNIDDLLSRLKPNQHEITSLIKQLYKEKFVFTALEEQVKKEPLEKYFNQRISKVKNRISEISNSISELINYDENVKNSILEAVRQEIRKYGYNANSILFELFQNADDALAELNEMLGHIHQDRGRYVIYWDTQFLTVMHWGRPINLYIHPDARTEDFSQQGFNQDLLKMLLFNISDKSEGTTGKFGLGFKTVHLISQEPKVISGDLSFVVQAGLLPFTLPREHCIQEDKHLLNDLSSRLKSEQSSSNITDGTLIHLEIDSKANADISNVVAEFEDNVNLLLVFAKFIKTCKFILVSSPKKFLTWQPTNLLGISGIEFGQIQIPQVKQPVREWFSYNLLCFQVKDASIAIVIPKKLSQSSSPSPLSDFPTFWVTAPTKERLGLRFVINAMFDLSTGRTNLDSNSARNLEIAQEIGKGLGEKLGELFHQSHCNWDTLCQTLKIESADEYTFWEFLWNVLVVDWLEKDTVYNTMDIIRSALSSADRGIGYLINNHAALPNGLYGKIYRQLISLENVSYVVEGILAEKEYFNKVVNWRKFQENCPSHCVIHSKVWKYVENLLSIVPSTPEKLQFVDILDWELGERKQVDPTTAALLGNIITSACLEQLQVSHRQECERIKTALQNVHFQSKDNKRYITALKLLVKGASQEENLLAAFAPNDRLLHPDYAVTSLEFFLACRKPRDIISEQVSEQEMVEWARNAKTQDKQQAVRQYLASGERKQGFANALRNCTAKTWIENDQGIQEILKVNSFQQKVEQAIRGEIAWSEVSNSSLEENRNEIVQEIIPEIPTFNIDETLREIYTWWRVNHITEIKKYNERLYPITIDKLKQKLQKRDRSAWIMLFFIGITHTMGRTKHEQHREFIRFCLERSWWETFTERNPHELSKKWMEVLDEYMDKQVEDTTWYYWMEKFPSIYRIASYLDAYIDSFLSIENIQANFNLRHITAPRTNPAFQGGGADAPPLPLGIGANFVLRELVRLEVINPITELSVHQHCFVPRANVRRLLIRLGCQDVSKPDYKTSTIIYKFLKGGFERLGLQVEPNFHHCFDIPFELYPEEPSRANRLNLAKIQVRDDVSWYESISDEEHSQYEYSSEDSDYVTLSNGRVIPRSYMG